MSPRMLLLLLTFSMLGMVTRAMPPPHLPHTLVKTPNPFLGPWTSKTHLTPYTGPRFNLADYTDPKTGLNPFIHVVEGNVPPRRAMDFEGYNDLPDALPSYRTQNDRAPVKRNETATEVTSRRSTRFTGKKEPVVQAGASMYLSPVEASGKPARRFSTSNLPTPSGFDGLRTIKQESVLVSKVKTTELTSIAILAETTTSQPAIVTATVIMEPAKNKLKSNDDRWEPNDIASFRENHLNKVKEDSPIYGKYNQKVINIVNAYGQVNETDLINEMERENHKHQAVMYSIILVAAASVFFAVLMAICIWSKRSNRRFKPKHRRQMLPKRQVATWRNDNEERRVNKHLTVSVC